MNKKNIWISTKEAIETMDLTLEQVKEFILTNRSNPTVVKYFNKDGQTDPMLNVNFLNKKSIIAKRKIENAHQLNSNIMENMERSYKRKARKNLILFITATFLILAVSAIFIIYSQQKIKTTGEEYQQNLNNLYAELNESLEAYSKLTRLVKKKKIKIAKKDFEKINDLEMKLNKMEDTLKIYINSLHQINNKKTDALSATTSSTK